MGILNDFTICTHNLCNQGGVGYATVHTAKTVREEALVVAKLTNLPVTSYRVVAIVRGFFNHEPEVCIELRARVRGRSQDVRAELKPNRPLAEQLERRTMAKRTNPVLTPLLNTLTGAVDELEAMAASALALWELYAKLDPVGRVLLMLETCGPLMLRKVDKEALELAAPVYAQALALRDKGLFDKAVAMAAGTLRSMVAYACCDMATSLYTRSTRLPVFAWMEGGR